MKYLVYIDYSDTHVGELVDKYVDDIWVDKETPIAETSCTIRIKEKGQFIVGVQSVLYDEEKSIKEHSVIAWSDNKKYTNNNPFGVRVRK